MTYPTKLIVVDADGELLSCSNGHISGSTELRRKAEIASLIGARVTLQAPFGEEVMADLTDPTNSLGIVAALFAAKPGRSRILTAPPEVWEWLDADAELNHEPISEDETDV